MSKNFHRRARGLSLIESMCCAAVTATLMGSALPTFDDLAQRLRLQSAGAELLADLQLARSTAMLRAEPVRLSWQAVAGAGVCYVVHTGNATQCGCGADLAPHCEAGVEVMRAVVLPAADAISLTAATKSVLFDARRGTVTPTATFKLNDRRGRALHLVVNIMGRVRSCSPGAQLPGVKAC